MNHRLKLWMGERNISLEEDFVSALEKHTKDYIKNNSQRIRDVYDFLGVSQQAIHKWRYNLTSTQTREGFKCDVIMKAGELFSFTYSETEGLANKAGLSLFRGEPPPGNDLDVDLFSKIRAPSCAFLCSDAFVGKFLDGTITRNDPYAEFSTEICIDIKEVSFDTGNEIFPFKNFKDASCKNSTNTRFSNHFYSLLSEYPGKKSDLYKAASISDRMFRHIKTGRYLRKESVLALLIVMGLGLVDIQRSLKIAGYILSHSIPNDAVILWILENDTHRYKGARRLYNINEILYSLELPLLMTRPKGQDGY